MGDVPSHVFSLRLFSHSMDQNKHSEVLHFRHFGKNRAGNANGCRFMADSIVGSSSMTVELCIQSNQSFLRDSAFTRISQFSLQHSVKQTSHLKNGQKRGTNLKQKQVLISGRCTKTMIAHRFSWTAKL